MESCCSRAEVGGNQSRGTGPVTEHAEEGEEKKKGNRKEAPLALYAGVDEAHIAFGAEAYGRCMPRCIQLEIDALSLT